MRPTFIVVGALKAGTTSLWQYLRLHPDVFMSDIKEPNFFLGYEEWHRGVEWYESLFAGAGDAKAVGEASAQYTYFPHVAGVPERIKAVVPDVRLVYVVRSPVERMISLYGHFLMAGWESRPIDLALLQDSRYSDSSRYALQLEQYRRHFPESQILLLTSEELRQSPEDAMRKVCEFLDIDARWRPPNLDVSYNTSEDQRVPTAWWRKTAELVIRTHSQRLVPDWILQHNRNRFVSRALRPSELVITEDTRRRLEDVLRPDVERLRTWMGPGFGAWGLLG